MADMTQVYTALRNADAAGDADAARQLVAYIQSQSAAPAQPQAEQPAQELGAFGQMGRGAINTGKNILAGAADIARRVTISSARTAAFMG